MTQDVAWDPITLEVMWQRLLSCASQASVTILRTAFSSVVTTSHDFRYVLTDGDGNSLAQSHLGEVMFVTTFPDCVKNIIAQVGRDQMRPGDVFITNDPWIAAGHLPDMHVATPVFKDGKLVAFSGSVIHLSDIGGRFGAHDATEVFEEGLCFPPVRLYDAGELNEEILQILRANVRASDLVQGDIMAQVAGNQLGANLLCEFLDEYDLDDTTVLSDALQSRVEAAMRTQIEALPDGEYHRRTPVETGIAGEELEIQSTITVAGDRMIVDYSGSSPQTDKAGVNCVLNCTRSLTLYPLQALFLSDVPSNEGAARPIEITAPEGTIMNALRPAPVDIRAMITHLLPDHVMGSLAQIIPERVSAASGIRWLLLADRAAAGTRGRMITSFFQAGGVGASANRDGPNAKFWPIKSYHTPVERFEVESGLLVEEKALRQDSGGAGRFRGGLGQRIVVSNPSSDVVKFTFYRPQMDHPAEGYFGGRAGMPGRAELDGEGVTSAVLTVAPGQRAVLETPGGGGFGLPDERPSADILEDLRQEYVSPAHAEAEYGLTDAEP